MEDFEKGADMKKYKKELQNVIKTEKNKILYTTTMLLLNTSRRIILKSK